MPGVFAEGKEIRGVAMTSTAKRVLTTVVTVPALFSFIFFLPHYSYLALAMLAVLVSIAGTKELKELYTKATDCKPHLPLCFAAVLPIAQWLQIGFFPDLPMVDLGIVLLALVIFSTELFYGEKDDFEKSLSRIGGESLLLLYPGLLTTFILRITATAHPSEYLILFFVLVFGNDIFAYIFGMWLGRSNKGYVKVSPNKSIAGFVGGTSASIILAIAFVLLIPSVQQDISLFQAIIIGLMTSIACNIGDLIESAFKRSAKVKDSGQVIPGRGGLLDSIDSMLASAPVFWLLLTIL